MDDSLKDLDQRLLTAYQNTTYRVPTRQLSLRIGAVHPDLDVLLAEKKATQWAFLTAYHPGSKPATQEYNTRAQEQLRQRLQAGRYLFWEGAGEADAGDWPPEPSFLILDIPLARAKEWAIEFGQVAFVYGRLGGAAELVFSKKG